MSLPRGRAIWVVLALHAVQAVFLIWLALDAVFCCDALYYLHVGQGMLAEGLLYDHHFEGYRSYLVPLLSALIDGLPLPAANASGSSYPLAASLVFWLISLACSLQILKHESLGRYLVFALPTLLNPFVLAHIPAPLQESAFVLLCVPLLVLLVAVQKSSATRTLGLALLIFTLAYVIRGSFIWLLVPLASFVLFEAIRSGSRWQRAKLAPLLLVGLLATVPLLAPQSWTMYQKFPSIHPYPSTAVMDFQIEMGVANLKYGTLKMDDHWTGMWYLSPYAYRPAEERTLGFYVRNPGPGLLLIGSHVWSGLHYDVLTTYVRVEELRIASPWLVLSSLIVAFGIIGLVQGWRSRAEPELDLLLTLMVLLSCAYTAFIATEARFGLVGFVALSIAAARSTAWPEGRRAMLNAAPLALIYALACLLFNGLLLQTVRVVINGEVVPLFG
jgi:hypothetical protein